MSAKGAIVTDTKAAFAALVESYQGGGHSVFRPSAASRWMVCAGSLQADILHYQDSAGIEAARGTVAHSISEDWLRTGKRPKIKPGSTRIERGFIIEIDDEMLAKVEEYVDWCNALGPADMVAVEQRVDFSDLTPIPDQGGTADHIHIARRTLTISDLKYGTAERVYARGNKQARLYAYGAWKEWSWAYEIDTIVIRICQPRLEVFETWTITLDELLAFAEEAKRAAHRAWEPGAPRTPDPNACKWCSVRGTCPALAVVAEALADDRLDDLEGQEVNPETVSIPNAILSPRSDPQKMSNEELGTVLRWRGTFDAWFRAAHEEALSRASDGGGIPGWKVKEGTTHRSWTNEKDAKVLLLALGLPEAQIETRKLISPKAASDMLRVKKIKPEAIKYAWTKPPGRLSLVSEDDGSEGLSDLSARLDDDDLA